MLKVGWRKVEEMLPPSYGPPGSAGGTSSPEEG